MKFNKWTIGLAAVGAVSLNSAARAAEATPAPTYLEAATKGISVSGYVDTSVEWALTPNHGTYLASPGGNYIPFRGNNNVNKQDGFNLNVVELNLEKPMDESSWAAGYKFQMLAGPDAVGYNSAGGGGDFGIKQAYVSLRTPIGNGIDWKIGTWDTIIGYEVFESGSNPNFTRSYGYAIEPTEHTGLLGTYKFNDTVSASFGIANTIGAGINARNRYLTGFTSNPQKTDWSKTYMGSVTLTAPSSWGFLAGSALYSGFVYGYPGGDSLNYYAGATLNTPVTGLTFGLSYDLVYFDQERLETTFPNSPVRVNNTSYDNIIGVYASFKASEKLTFNARAEWWNTSADQGLTGTGTDSSTSTSVNSYELTLTAQYDLWANVISRLELRWDNIDKDLGPGADQGNSLGLYANVIYKF